MDSQFKMATYHLGFFGSIDVKEAKDLYGASLQNTDTGFSIRNKSGDVSIRKFINTLDFSLDAMKLREVYEKKEIKFYEENFIGYSRYRYHIMLLFHRSKCIIQFLVGNRG